MTKPKCLHQSTLLLQDTSNSFQECSKSIPTSEDIDKTLRALLSNIRHNQWFRSKMAASITFRKSQNDH